MDHPRCLVIEDDPSLREAIGLVLEEEGYDAELAEHGRAALERLISGARPDVIVTDLMMPVMDGRHFIREVLARPDLRSIPLVVLTASVEAADLGDQVFAILHKPLDLESLYETVARAVKLARAPAGDAGFASFSPDPGATARYES